MNTYSMFAWQSTRIEYIFFGSTADKNSVPLSIFEALIFSMVGGCVFFFSFAYVIILLQFAALTRQN